MQADSPLVISNSLSDRLGLFLLVGLTTGTFIVSAIILTEIAVIAGGIDSAFAGCACIAIAAVGGMTHLSIKEHRNIVRKIEFGEQVVVYRKRGDSTYEWRSVSTIRGVNSPNIVGVIISLFLPVPIPIPIESANSTLYFKFDNGDAVSICVTSALLAQILEVIGDKNSLLLREASLGSGALYGDRNVCHVLWRDQTLKGHAELFEHENAGAHVWYGQIRPSIEPVANQELEEIDFDDVDLADRMIQVRFAEGRSGQAFIKSARLLSNQGAYVLDFVGLSHLA